MRFDAKDMWWMPMNLKGVNGYFNDMRIEQSTVPTGFIQWELADDDSNGIPCRYRRGILVNFYGTFLTTGELPIDDKEMQAGYIETEDEYKFTPESALSYEEMYRREFGGKMLW